MELWDILSVAAAFAVTGWFIKIVLSRDRDDDRLAEDDARAFFDRHGVWPDEVKDRLPPDGASGRTRRSSRR